jgi:phosphoribosylformimino-5-aminoimidazole carboxamide ribotide isomerase
MVTNIITAFPQLEIWLDAGLTTTEEINQWRNTKVRIVLGSESLDSIETYQHLLNACETTPVLSLDFKSGNFLGPQDLLISHEHWTQDVIVMTLDQVGSDAGPDFERLKRIQELSASRSIYAAGGIRSAHDLANLKDQGVAGGLLASALHSRAISRDDLEKLQA